MHLAGLDAAPHGRTSPIPVISSSLATRSVPIKIRRNYVSKDRGEEFARLDIGNGRPSRVFSWVDSRRTAPRPPRRYRSIVHSPSRIGGTTVGNVRFDQAESEKYRRCKAERRGGHRSPGRLAWHSGHHCTSQVRRPLIARTLVRRRGGRRAEPLGGGRFPVGDLPERRSGQEVLRIPVHPKRTLSAVSGAPPPGRVERQPAGAVCVRGRGRQRQGNGCEVTGQQMGLSSCSHLAAPFQVVARASGGRAGVAIKARFDEAGPATGPALCRPGVIPGLVCTGSSGSRPSARRSQSPRRGRRTRTRLNTV